MWIHSRILFVDGWMLSYKTTRDRDPTTATLQGPLGSVTEDEVIVKLILLRVYINLFISWIYVHYKPEGVLYYAIVSLAI